MLQAATVVCILFGSALQHAHAIYVFDAACLSASLHEWIAATVQAAMENSVEMEARLPPSFIKLHTCQLFQHQMHNAIRRDPGPRHLGLQEAGYSKAPFAFVESER